MSGKGVGNERRKLDGHTKWQTKGKVERAVAEQLNIVDVLDNIFSEEAKLKRKRAYEKQIQMSGFPIKKTLDDFDFSFQPSIDKR